MSEVIEPLNEVTVAPSVLLTVVQRTVLGIAGVARLATVPGGVNRLLRSGIADGVRLVLKDHTVQADIFIHLAGDALGTDVSAAIQAQVAQALHDVAGLTVTAVNIIIAEVVFAD